MVNNHGYHELFRGLKAIYDSRSDLVALIKSTNRSKMHTNLQFIRVGWKGHFYYLLNQQGFVQPDVCK